jgi:branched-chain amino acid transport system ATP-binding protein
MLQVSEINTYYGRFHVLKNISFIVEDREIVVFLGANGHGKSTLLKTICGLIQPSTGSITFQGIAIHNKPMHKIVEMGIIYIPEERHLFPDLTVQENLLLGAYNQRARKERQIKYQLVFDLFPKLKERKNQIASTLSGGERQMLAIGRGLMSNAKLMAIDEPSLGLAPIVKKEVFQKIKEINEQQGLTILLVEQEIESSLAISRKGFVIKDGRIVLQNESKYLTIDLIRKQYLV